LIQIFFDETSCQKFGFLGDYLKKMPKVNNCPNGGNLPNLVTLALCRQFSSNLFIIQEWALATTYAGVKTTYNCAYKCTLGNYAIIPMGLQFSAKLLS
jgi:hypothetical protein